MNGSEREATTSQNGEERACVQCTKCIDVCPVGLMPNLVFKAALEGDIERMERVFIHDCIDCGLCTFVCPSKIELGQHIEDGKALIAKEGGNKDVTQVVLDAGHALDGKHDSLGQAIIEWLNYRFEKR